MGILDDMMVDVSVGLSVVVVTVFDKSKPFLTGVAIDGVISIARAIGRPRNLFAEPA